MHPHPPNRILDISRFLAPWIDRVGIFQSQTASAVAIDAEAHGGALLHALHEEVISAPVPIKEIQQGAVLLFSMAVSVSVPA